MNISVNGQSQVPPGFRFHPTEEELLVYYLKNKVASQKFEFDVIRDIDLNKLEPWDIQERCRIGSGPQNEWYLFSHKDKKYPTGSRTNRATSAGFWKATGRDKVIYGTGGTAGNCTTSMCIGMRKTLVFYMGRAPHGHKSDWIMHEYRLLDDIIHMSNKQQLLTKDVVDVDHSQLINNNAQASLMWEELDESSATAAAEERWVICRVFRKKNYVKAIDSNIINNRSTTTTIYGGSSSRSKSSSSKSMDHMLNCQLGDQTDYQIERFIHLPQLESPTHHHLTAPLISISSTTTTTGTVTPTPTLLLDHDAGSTSTYQSIFLAADMRITNCCPPLPHEASSSTTTTRNSTSWVELDKLVAYHLNEQAAAGATDQSSDFDNTAGIVTSTTPEDHNFMNSSFQELLSSSDHHASSHDYNLWSCFSKRSSPAPSSTLDPISHLSVL